MPVPATLKVLYHEGYSSKQELPEQSKKFNREVFMSFEESEEKSDDFDYQLVSTQNVVLHSIEYEESIIHDDGLNHLKTKYTILEENKIPGKNLQTIFIYTSNLKY